MSLRRLWLLVIMLLLMSAPIVLAQEVVEEQGTIDANNREATFDLELTAGETITVTVTATSGDLDPILELLTESGDVVAENDDIDTDGGNFNSELTYSAEAAGIYTIRITAFQESEGNFLLTVAFGETSSNEDSDNEFSDDESPEADDERPDLDQTLDTEHFVIHYTEDGENAADSDYIAAAAEIVEQVWQIEIEEMGWPAPPTDAGAGGDDRFDMYLMNLCGDEELYGYAQPEGEEGDNPNTAEEEPKSSSSYLVVDNDFNDDCFEGGTGDLHTTVAHEFHHNIQFGYDVEDVHSWYYEATATWMETQVAGDEQQATMYVSSLFETPEVCFGSAENDQAYGTYLFIQSLVDAYGEQIVIELWQNIAQVEGFEALQITLEAYGEDIPTAVARYHLQNLVRAYPLADEFGVTVYLENTIDDAGDWSYTGDGIQEMGANYFALDLEAGNYSAYVNGGDNRDLSLYAIGIVEGGADVYLLDSNSVFTTDGYDYVYLMIFNWAYDDDLEDCEFLTDYDITVEESEDEPVDIETTLDASSFEPLGN